MKTTHLLAVILAVVSGFKSVYAQEQLPTRYQPSNPDTPSELSENPKAALIANGKVFIKRGAPPQLDQEGSLQQARVAPSQMVATKETQAACGLRIAVPENAGYGGPVCVTSKKRNEIFGLDASVNFDKYVTYGHPIMKQYTQGYKYDDHFVEAVFFIHDHESFEQRLLKSAQLGVGNKGLVMDGDMTPLAHTESDLWAAKSPISTSLRTKVLGGTQMIIGKAVWAHRYRGKTLYSTCIYSLHGHVNRSAEALTCFGGVKGKFFSNKYVDQYMLVLESIRLAP